MKTFIISIEEENSPRLNKFLSQPFFQKNHLTYEKVGVKGGDLSAKEYFELGVKGRSKPLTPAELGCSLSHLTALRHFLESLDEYALIFEDDAVIPKDLNVVDLEKAIKNYQLPENILFSLGGIQMKESRKVRGSLKVEYFLSKSVIEVNPHFYNRVNYAVAYIVDRAMASTLINYHQRIRKADDWSYLFDFNDRVNIYMTYLIDHPVIEIGEKNLELSSIEVERAISQDLPESKYGKFLGNNFAKLKYKNYPL